VKKDKKRVHFPFPYVEGEGTGDERKGGGREGTFPSELSSMDKREKGGGTLLFSFILWTGGKLKER